MKFVKKLLGLLKRFFRTIRIISTELGIKYSWEEGFSRLFKLRVSSSSKESQLRKSEHRVQCSKNLLLHIYLDNFTQTWYKASLGKDFQV